MEEIMRKITIYHKLYVGSLLTALIIFVFVLILWMRWKIYQSLKSACGRHQKKENNGRIKNKKEEVIDERTNVTVRLKVADSDATEFIVDHIQWSKH